MVACAIWMAEPREAPDRALHADVIGGVTTFFTMAYIVIVNPTILATPGTGVPFSGALTATVLIASSMTLLMGLYARLPFAVAPGMGLNAFFAFAIVLQAKVPWQTALGMVFWSGVLFLVVSATPLREHIALAIPSSLRAAASAGIGLLLTFIGVASVAGLTDSDGRPINLRRGLIVDAIATLGSGLAGTSPGTAYVESIAGIRMGARTGRASVVTALCFVPCFFLGPLAAAVPGYATAPVLILVGVSMFQAVSMIDFFSLEDSLPAFVTVVLIPLTLSITQGILWGFLLHALLYAVAGRLREVSLTLWLLSALSAGLLLLGHLARPAYHSRSSGV